MKATIILMLDGRGSFEVPLELARPLYENLRGLFEDAPPRLVDEPYTDPEPPQKATKVTKLKREKHVPRAKASAGAGSVTDDVRALLPKLPDPFRAKDLTSRLPQHKRVTVATAMYRLEAAGELNRTGQRANALWTWQDAKFGAPPPSVQEEDEARWRDKNLPATARIDALRRLEDRGAITSETYANRRSLILSEG